MYPIDLLILQTSNVGRYVKVGDIVEDVTRDVIAKAINDIIIKKTLVKHVSVAQDQLAALRDVNGNFRTNIPERK